MSRNSMTALAAIAAILIVLAGALLTFGALARSGEETAGTAAASGSGEDGGDGQADAVGAISTPPSADEAGAADAGPTTTFQATDATVEADAEAVEEAGTSGGGTAGKDGGEPQGPENTVPTVPPPTSGTCRVQVDGLSAGAGPVTAGSGGACEAVAVTAQAVNPRQDGTDVDWGRELLACERHPAATEIEVLAVTTGGASLALSPSLVREADQAATDPIAAFEITFAGQATPLTASRPILACRASDVTLSIVHRPPT